MSTFRTKSWAAESLLSITPITNLRTATAVVKKINFACRQQASHPTGHRSQVRPDDTPSSTPLARPWGADVQTSRTSFFISNKRCYRLYHNLHISLGAAQTCWLMHVRMRRSPDRCSGSTWADIHPSASPLSKTDHFQNSQLIFIHFSQSNGLWRSDWFYAELNNPAPARPETRGSGVYMLTPLNRPPQMSAWFDLFRSGRRPNWISPKWPSISCLRVTSGYGCRGTQPHFLIHLAADHI